MAVPLSLKSKFFSMEDSKSNSLLGGYCHKKLETIKMKGNSKSGHWAFKGSFNLDKNGLVKYSDEFSYGFGFLDRLYLQARMDRKGGLRYHLDMGNLDIHDHKIDLSATVKTNMNLGNLHWRLATHYKTKGFEHRGRIERDANSKPCVSWCTLMKHGQLKAASAVMVHLDSMSVRRYDASLLLRMQKGMHFSLVHHTPLLAEQVDARALGKVTAGLAFKIDKKTRAALQLSKAGDKLRAQLGVDHKVCSHFSVKAKCDNNTKCTFMFNKKINDMLSVSVASQLNFNKSVKTVDMDSVLPFPMGYSLEVRV